MTAEVAVINSLGVAIAADSAVTIGNKTYYTQQKIFNLSNKHSVGIMVYGSSDFMYVDWEIIINEYNKALGDRVLDTLEEYAKYLLVFLRDFKYVDTDQKLFLSAISGGFFEEIKEGCENEISENHKDQEINKALQNKILSGEIKKAKTHLENNEDYVGFKDDGFVRENRAIIAEEVVKIFPEINDKLKEELIDLFLSDIRKIEIAPWWRYRSGIVFAGYGDKEIFPSSVDFALYGKLGENILHNTFNITNTTCIFPFSQPNVINSFIRGMDPDFRDMIDNELDALTAKVTDITGKKHSEDVGKLIKELKDKIQTFQDEKYKDPVVDLVRSMPKSNLAEMAEALVNLTGLRQRVSTEEQTVGGPTDVALITKTDGFVWIKKKQIFHDIQG